MAYPSTGGVNDYDYSSGHGTHVCGTVAGAIANDTDYAANVAVLGNSEYAAERGMAPDAQILAYDIGDSSGSLSIPYNYYTSLFPPAFDAGARISCVARARAPGARAPVARLVNSTRTPARASCVRSFAARAAGPGRSGRIAAKWR